MGKRHNRKRTRSRPRHRDGNVNQQAQHQYHARSVSVDTTSSVSSIASPSTLSATSSTFHPMAHLPRDHWHQTYLAWQMRQDTELERQQEVEMQRLRIFGGHPGDETSLLEPMLKVVTDLFDGFTDYEDP